MKATLDFQSIMITLQDYWAKQGCLIWQPYYSQVGAGTMNPATVLRVLGPEPWNVAYVEPSVRPDDGRYGENPNRLQQHYQYQVILKPDPGNPQELYLRSLEALGIDPRQHDIRFVEDNWESPALGAWGLGWEVWLDGLEITQFTYFQQAGGMVLDPVSVEITYGLERIAMALQNVRNFRDIRWNNQRSYGDINLQAEQEHSKYYFEIADVERLRKMYEAFEAEAETALANKLVLPAHDYVLKCSHTFNVLDTRGAIGVTERQALFSRMRDLSRRVSEAYVAYRESLGFPWIGSPGLIVSGKESQSININDQGNYKTDVDQLLFEIGTEELPAADLISVTDQLKERLPGLLDELHLKHGHVDVFSTPRRLVVFVDELVSQQPDLTTVVKGPPADRAFNPDGTPTKAGEGFARGKGLQPKDLEIREIDGGRYVTAQIHEKGRPSVEVLSEVLPDLIAALRFEKTMRWNASNVAFSRPIRWLLAIFGGRVIPFSYAGLNSGRVTRLLRFGDPVEASVANVQEYFKLLANQGIILNQEKRQSLIVEQVKLLATEVEGEAVIEQGLLEEVTNLVEAPTALRGSFDQQHLRLPEEVLVSVMKKHQRYFPVRSNDGQLLPYFIAVRNGDGKHLDIVTDGNEQVVRARFADAAFFIEEDFKHKLEDLLPRLGTLTFQFKLGSMLDKTKRIEKLVENLFPFFKLDEAEKSTTRRAAHLCKADLVSHMVVEMTSLQGIMGEFYARHDGEEEPVAKAIFEHYLPRYAGDGIPAALPGLIVGLADRLDTLAGLFAAGLAPSGAKDPFAQRRAALGLVQNLTTWNLDFDLYRGIALASEGLPLAVNEETLKSCLDFIVGRMRNAFIEEGFRYDVVDAVLVEQQRNPAGARRAIEELSHWIERPDWDSILPAYSRCVRITRDQKEIFTVKPDSLIESSERQLHDAIRKVEAELPKDGSPDSLLRAFKPMIPVINAFFDAVLVMAEDVTIRQNRLGLLQRISSLTKGVADLSQLEGF